MRMHSHGLRKIIEIHQHNKYEICGDGGQFIIETFNYFFRIIYYEKKKVIQARARRIILSF